VHHVHLTCSISQANGPRKLLAPCAQDSSHCPPPSLRMCHDWAAAPVEIANATRTAKPTRGINKFSIRGITRAPGVTGSDIAPVRADTTRSVKVVVSKAILNRCHSRRETATFQMFTR
jgi:hypothetical protein